MSIVWDVAYLFALVAFFPVVLYRMITRGKYRHGLLERLGFVPRRTGGRECLWVHGVSMGEVLASRTLVAAFRERHPDWDVVVSTTTDTGRAAALRHFPDCTVFRYPLDFSFAVAASLARVRPSVVVLMELELWPNFTRACERRGVPVLIVNGRLSERGHRRQHRFRFVLGPSYARVSRIGAQTERYARRFVDVGAPPGRVVVTGSMKYDAASPEPGDVAPLRRELALAPDAAILVAGSTFAGEDEIVLDVYARVKRDFPALRLAIVPRHPERADVVASLIRARGFDVLRRSNPSTGPTPDAVILGDTTGELVRFYALASVVFVGKSLVTPGGGQNIIEPAALGKPVLFGPHMDNFRETRDRLLEADAAREVADAGSLAAAVTQLLSDKDLATAMGGRARAALRDARGATRRTLELVEETLASRAGTV
ncbi:MAG TPA: 3-deoxy-D-manno-octulosonic acid transferase [Planctomycetota bacterium]|nr:3-deoxy-D-manno-octulosonic acid transferase [Planctomycetota bacterium]